LACSEADLDADIRRSSTTASAGADRGMGAEQAQQHLVRPGWSTCKTTP
jgi:hypothetical protein